MNSGVCIAVASNDKDILARNLLASDIVGQNFTAVQIDQDAGSATIAYNRMLDQCRADYVVFAHQDVYFPPGWGDRLQSAIKAVETLDPNWAVIAPTGISLDGQHVGPVWSTSQGAIVGQHITAPVAAQSFDELAIILRRPSGIRFDESAPGFHFFGTDVVQSARAKGQGAYVCDLPLVHNDVFHDRLGADFGQGYAHTRRKWAKVLPLKTTVLEVTRAGATWPIYRLRAANSVKSRGEKALDNNLDPRVYSHKCGWETNATPTS